MNDPLPARAGVGGRASGPLDGSRTSLHTGVQHKGLAMYALVFVCSLLCRTDPAGELCPIQGAASLGLSPAALASAGMTGTQTAEILQLIASESEAIQDLARIDADIVVKLREIDGYMAIMAESPRDIETLSALDLARHDLAGLKTVKESVRLALWTIVCESLPSAAETACQLAKTDPMTPASLRASPWFRENRTRVMASISAQQVSARHGASPAPSGCAAVIASLTSDSDIAVARAALSARMSEVDAAFHAAANTSTTE